MATVLEAEEQVFRAKSKEPKKKHFSLVCEEEDESAVTITSSEIILTELSTYMTLKANVTEYSCPLGFYKRNEHLLPNMARIAKLVFCTTASSVPSECLFSSAGELISHKRTRLHPECAQELLLLKKTNLIKLLTCNPFLYKCKILHFDIFGFLLCLKLNMCFYL